MWFVIFAEDHDDSLAKRKQARPAHIKRLEALKEQGRLLVAGPCPASDPLGRLQIIENATLIIGFTIFFIPLSLSRKVLGLRCPRPKPQQV